MSYQNPKVNYFVIISGKMGLQTGKHVKDTVTMRILGIDPGETVGLCLYRGSRLAKGREVKSSEEIIDFIQSNKPHQVVMEDFILSSRPSRAKIPIEQIGVIKYYCKLNDIPLTMQTPSALAFGKKKIGQVHPSKHVMSACYHVVYFLHKKRV